MLTLLFVLCYFRGLAMHRPSFYATTEIDAAVGTLSSTPLVIASAIDPSQLKITCLASSVHLYYPLEMMITFQPQQ